MLTTLFKAGHTDQSSYAFEYQKCLSANITSKYSGFTLRDTALSTNFLKILYWIELFFCINANSQGTDQ